MNIQFKQCWSSCHQTLQNYQQQEPSDSLMEPLSTFKLSFMLRFKLGFKQTDPSVNLGSVKISPSGGALTARLFNGLQMSDYVKVYFLSLCRWTFSPCFAFHNFVYFQLLGFEATNRLFLRKKGTMFYHLPLTSGLWVFLYKEKCCMNMYI